MSYNTIVRSFNHEDLYKAAQMHNLQTIYTLKYIVYTIITFFTCQNIIKMRELRRQEEIYQVTKDLLENLPKNYNNLAFGKVIEIQTNKIRVAKIVKIGDTFQKGNVSSLYNDNVFIINDDFLEKKLEVLNVN